MTEGRSLDVSDELRQIVNDRYLHGTPLGDVLSGLAHILDPGQKPDPQLEPDGSTGWAHPDEPNPDETPGGL